MKRYPLLLALAIISWSDLSAQYFSTTDFVVTTKNLFNDAKHSAHGLQCYALITNDRKCYLKSKFLFEFIGSKSILIKTVKVKDIEVLKNELESIFE